MKSTSRLMACYASLAILIVLATSRVHASLIASDTFNYPNGNLGTQNGGTGSWTSAWTPVAPATNGSWTVISGVAQTVGDDGGNANFMRRAVTVPNSSTSNYYFRFDYTMPTPGGGEGTILSGFSIGSPGTFTGTDVTVFTQEVPSGGQAYHLRMKLGFHGSMSNVGGPGGGAGTTLTYGQAYTVVGRIEPNYLVAGDTRLTVWLKTPTNVVTLSESDPAYMQDTLAGFILNPQFVSLYRETQNFTSVSTDNIFLGTSLGDVIPEPASVALISLGLVGLLMRRRTGRLCHLHGEETR